MTLIRPSALPDELAASYLGRVFRINGYTDPKRGLVELLDWAGLRGASRREAPLVQVIAKIAGIELHQFVANHTMLPLTRAVSKDSAGGLLSCEIKSTTPWAFAMRRTRPELFFCPHCVEEDIDFHGQSYWRREHQIPGQFFCSKHVEVLHFSKSVDAKWAFPSEIGSEAFVPRPEWIDKVRVNTVVQRYLGLCTSMLQRAEPFNEKQVSRTAICRARALGLHTGYGVVKKPLLSDLVRKQFDSQWLENVIPNIKGLPINQIYQPLEAVLCRAVVGQRALAYMLAFSVLYEDADEAFNALVESYKENSRARMRNRVRDHFYAHRSGWATKKSALA